MENPETGKASRNTTQEFRRNLIRTELLRVYELIGQRADPHRINLYATALDDLTPGQIDYGFAIVKREVGEFLPAVATIREACESWRPSEIVELPPLEKSHLIAAGNRSGVTHEEVMQWLREGQRAQQEHYANLEADPNWQSMVARLNHDPRRRR